MSNRLVSVDSLMLHDAVLIESDLSSLSDSDWQAMTPSGRSLSRVKSELEQGASVVLRDTPTSPVFSMEHGKPLANSAYGNGISAQTLTQLSKRFESAGSGSFYNANSNGNLHPSPPLDYIADTSKIREIQSQPKFTPISDNFSKLPPKLELELCYDDSEKTYASNVPYSVIFSDPAKTVIKGVLNDKGWAMVEGGPNYPAKVLFGDESEKVAAELTLEAQYQQLDKALNDTAKQVAQHLLDVKNKAKQSQLIEVTESFKTAVDSKVAELNSQSEAFDNLSYLTQTWELAKATKEGASNGVTEYLPDLGDFGKLMDAADIDITMLIDAISTGNINALETKLKQWKTRGGEGFTEARKTMETLILLLSDPTSREMLASVPKRIIAALPEDQVAELAAYQVTQLGMDTAVVAGGTAVGTLAGGVGGPVAAGILFTATTARKGGKALEGTINIVTDISKSLKKVNNQHDITPYKKENTLPLATGKGKSSNDKNDEDETYKCDWNHCKGGHKKKIKYPNNGKLGKSGNYAKKWVAAGLEPWELYGPGEDSQATLEEYQAENKSPNIVRNAVAMSHPAYPTQKHHLISVNLFKNVPKLKHNAKLAGYDVNHSKNGVCLPAFTFDIIQHDLQCHRGNHSNDNYYEKVAPYLRDIQRSFKKACSKEANDIEYQKELIDELNNLSLDIFNNIKHWNYLLRKNAHAERKIAIERMR